jgi:predicted nucleotidyltransferase
MAKRKVIEAIKFLESSLIDSGLNVSKIILFGSQAKGSQTKESDVDLIIISDDFKGKNIFERAEITKGAEINTIKKFLIPFDIITLTSEEFENSMFFEYTEESKVIYA